MKASLTSLILIVIALFAVPIAVGIATDMEKQYIAMLCFATVFAAVLFLSLVKKFPWHPSKRMLKEYADGTLSNEYINYVGMHLMYCKECKEKLNH